MKSRLWERTEEILFSCFLEVQPHKRGLRPRRCSAAFAGDALALVRQELESRLCAGHPGLAFRVLPGLC